MKILLLVIINLFCISLRTQNNSFIITNKLDTIYGHIKLFGNTNYLNLSRHTEELIFTVNGEEKTYVPDQVKAFVFYDGDTKYFFRTIPELKKYKFFHVVIDGKISLCYDYHGLYSNTNRTGYILKDESILSFGILQIKKKLATFLMDDNEIYNAWIKDARPLDMEKFIIRYNEKHSK
jgi:hypothetical protein